LTNKLTITTIYGKLGLFLALSIMHIKYNHLDILEKYKRFGIKIYKFCDTAGSTYDMNVYLGKDRRAHQAKTVSHDMDRDLCKWVNEVGHKLYIDNFFSS
jgi:hypothetical protein